MTRFNPTKTFFYFLTLLSTLFILFMTFSNNKSLAGNDATGAFIALSGLIEFGFSIYILITTADSQH